MKKLKYWVKKEWFLILLTILFFALLPYSTPKIDDIDFPTIRALIALIILTTAFEEAKIFEYLSEKILIKINDQKKLVIFLILLTTILSMFLTNDITLFVVVPLTLALLKNPVTIIIFEALAANIGSSLTPIGNPQNLYIFRQMDISFFEFIKMMSVVFLPQFILLLIFSAFIKNRQISGEKEKIKINLPLFISTLILFIIFLISLELNLVRYALIIIIAFYLFSFKEVLTKFDIFLIATFILMFLDFAMLSRIINLHNLDKLETFNYTLLLSQIISNVPATIFISHYSDNLNYIAYGANIVGGTLISSLANFIALRFIQKGYIKFHLISIPFIFFSYLLILLIIQK